MNTGVPLACNSVYVNSAEERETMKKTKTLDDFRAVIKGLIEALPTEYCEPEAWALGLATYTTDGEFLDIRFPGAVNRYDENLGTAKLLFGLSTAMADPAVNTRLLSLDDLVAATHALAFTKGDGKVHSNLDGIRAIIKLLERTKGKAGFGRVYAPVLAWIPDLDHSVAPADAIDARLRLEMVSRGALWPNETNMSVFGVLPNVVWTSHGPFLPHQVEKVRWKLLGRGETLTVMGVDKFPHMLNYVVPPGVRVADASRVRLGAHLAAGTTVMHEGFVNFNAGTLKGCMVEGRISAGVVIEGASDIGGGASIMGTLSGGGTIKVSIGDGCLLGANSGIGIPLGDNVIVEAGLYLTAGTKVIVPEDLGLEQIEYQEPECDRPVVQARDLAGISNVIFRRHSLTGRVEVIRNGQRAVTLNAALHANS